MTDPEDIVGYTVEHTHFAHTTLFGAAQTALEEGRSAQATEKYMVALVMAAFSFEAYLNYAGGAIFPFWAEVERIKTENKLRMICKHLGHAPDFGRRPYQTLVALWRVRDKLAHARTKTLSVVREGPPSDPIDVPLTDWQTACVLDEAERAIEDVKAISDDLHRKAKLPFGAIGDASTTGAEILRRVKPSGKKP